MSSKIIGTGKYLPKKVVTNQDLSKIVDTTDEWIFTRTGIKSRHQSDQTESASYMAYKASKKAIKDAKINKEDIDLIVVATITGDGLTPSVANKVQGLLEIENAMSFDINAACSGFVYALDIVNSMFISKKYKNALVIGSEKLSKVINYEDRSTCVLFGDGAGAAVVTSDNNKDYYYSDASYDYKDNLTINKTIAMDGRKVYLFAVKTLEAAINKVLEEANLSIEQIDKIIPHQANVRIIQAVAKNMKIDIDKFYINIRNYGNTSAASIPVALSEFLENDKQAKKVLIVGFGGGFTWSSAIINVGEMSI